MTTEPKPEHADPTGDTVGPQHTAPPGTPQATGDTLGTQHTAPPHTPEAGETVEEEPEPFSDGPPPLPTPMLVLDGTLPEEPAPAPDPEQVDHGTCRCGGKFDADGWCTECGERRPDPRHHFTAQASPAVAAVCDRGVRHTDNEDAMAVWADEEGRVALVVCDGVSTAARSAEASLAAADAAVQVLSSSTDAPPERLVTATSAAAAAVDQVGLDFPDSAPSCTFVAAVVEDGTATVGSVGDSRGYWLPDQGEAHRLTTDDSMAEEQVRAGMDRASAETSPLAHTITRWLGPDGPDHTPEITTADVDEPGWVLLCSDGLWNYASEPADLRAVVRAEERRVGRDPLVLAQALVAWANGRGGADNITVALARTGGGATDRPAGDAEPTVETAYPQPNDTPTAGQDGTHA
ncbi:PP2C family protein-serine/threonine phosphatase [Ornithinimicrobium avium]|uniref:Serine/threonine-protein phosphatase n=1 Tax=Ornithinimicrobium avium TaxID=2283195 RepID=A0A345NKZ6_9MICO|nr:PP2C family serine/threonine-protein phosphatase [Ornithinimicrobium avium]AXH95704.1 serine/threonine-protein phosphatase [Ornithinimicrobium avium]